MTYDPVESVWKQYPMVRGIMKGEGEETFLQLLRMRGMEKLRIMIWMESRIGKRQPARSWNNPDQKTMDMNELPFVYQDMDLFRHKIVYL